MLKRYLVTGLLVWVPLAITLWVISLVVGTLDQLVPTGITSNDLFGRHVPGFGVLVVLAVVLLTGILATNFIGRRLVSYWERLLTRIPLVRSIYSSVKQVSDTVLAPNGRAFRRALLVQYPRAGSWTIAFQTGKPSAEVALHVNEPLVSVYVPTTPNPTSGFFLMMRPAEIIELDMSVDDALKYVVSMGVVVPDGARAPRARAPKADPGARAA